METKCREPQAMQKWRLNGRNVLKKHRFRTFKRYFLHLFTIYGTSTKLIRMGRTISCQYG